MSSVEQWAIRYIQRYGLALVPIPPGHKAPLYQGWNQPGGYVTDVCDVSERWDGIHDHGIGAVLSPSGLCSIDVDAPDHALPVLGALGIDLYSLRKATPTIQGDPSRYRMMFKARRGVVLGRKNLAWPARQIGEKPITLFELRAGHIQDVLPPTIHPGTGKPYVWLTPPNSEFPPLPEALLELWEHWDSYRKELEAMCPWGKLGFNPEPAPRGDGARPNVIAAFNQVHSGEELLGAHGYTRRGKRWISPTSSSGLAGITILDGRVYSHHASDPLADSHAHDAFDILRILDHGGDARSAVKAAAEELGMGSTVAKDEPRAGNGASPEGDSASPEWPQEMDPCAYYGIAGEMVKSIEPHTEADPAALLIQVAVAFGVLVGRSPYVQVEGDQHYPNLFALLIGATSKGRKGTSWGRVRSIFERVHGWPRVVSGLSSGEGLKWQVRDPRTEMVKDKKSGVTREEVVDEGVPDKRLLVIEPEFAQVLRVVARHGNTLSSTTRTAWDTGTLATLTKNDPVTATDAHISIIGHVTVDELRAELTQTDTANGFANRFLFLCVKRSKCLPFGGADLPESVLSDFAQRLERTASSARRVGRVVMTQPAREIWERVYPQLSEGMSGLFGAATARAEAQVVRLAMLYALLDEKAQIDMPHLLAALALWEYAEASARHVFGSSLGDPIADEILRAVRAAGQDGMTRTQIRDLFKRNCSAERIGAALDLLARRNLVRRRTQETGGRPSEVWVSA
jgi:hypothetical protein